MLVRRGTCIVSMVALALAAQARAAVVIDLFTTTQGPLQRVVPGDFGTPISSTADGGGIIGGERDIEVSLTSAAGPPGNRINVSVTSFNHSQDGGVFGQSFTSWDGDDNDGSVVDFTGLGGADLTDGLTQDSLEVSIISADLNSTIVFTVYTDGGNASAYSLFLPGGSSNDVYIIPFASFSVTLGAGADFTNVGAITMLVDGSALASLDVILELLQTANLIDLSKVDALTGDVDGDANVDVGDVLTYTVVINNPDDEFNAAYPNASFTDTPPAGTALVVGSVTTTQGVVVTGNTGGDTSVNVSIGNIADGTSVTITYQVLVTDEVNQVCNQGFIDTNPTNDPSTGDDFDPTCVPVTFCGDGIVNDVTEECDDGNNVDTDACTNICRIARCGDGIVRVGVEECDDGNNIDTDSCTNACQNAECGDGIVQIGVEECDDGNMSNADSCLNTCEFNECGDGFVEVGVEECDDGNMVDNDGCTNACTLPRCGDGVVQSPEECDDGNNTDGDGCQGDCLNPVCGDGIVDAGEACDDGNNVNTDNCTNACEFARCGDGFVQPGEQCDDGNAVNNDGCSNACALPDCGDGIVQAGEQCDDGNNVGGDGCSATCQSELCGNDVVDPGEECDGSANQACGGSPCSASCTCEDGVIPTVSEWGLVIFSLLLLSGAKVYFGRRPELT